MTSTGRPTRMSRRDFLTRVSSAIRMGTAAPPELMEFAYEREMWQAFGVRANPERLEDWPRRKAEHYGLFIQLIRENESKATPQPRR